MKCPLTWFPMNLRYLSCQRALCQKLLYMLITWRVLQYKCVSFVYINVHREIVMVQGVQGRPISASRTSQQLHTEGDYPVCPVYEALVTKRTAHLTGVKAIGVSLSGQMTHPSVSVSTSD